MHVERLYIYRRGATNACALTGEKGDFLVCLLLSRLIVGNSGCRPVATQPKMVFMALQWRLR